MVVFALDSSFKEICEMFRHSILTLNKDSNTGHENAIKSVDRPIVQPQEVTQSKEHEM